MADKGKKDPKKDPKKDTKKVAKKGGKDEKKEYTVREYPQRDESLPHAFNVFNAGLAGALGAIFVHPLDVLKFRKQMCKKSVPTLSIAQCIQCQEGNLKFFRGLSSSLLRQLTFRPARFAAFYGLHELYKEHNEEAPTFGIMALMATMAGAFGAFVGTPPDLVLARTAPNGRLPPPKRRCYTHVFDAFSRINCQEGAMTLWRGAMPTIARGAIITLTQFLTFTELKKSINEQFELEDGYLSDIGAATIAAFIAAGITMPLDIAKTRIQNFKIVEPHKNPGTLKVVQCIAETETSKALWKGFMPAFIRISVHTVLVILLQDMLAKSYKENFHQPKPDDKGKGKGKK